MKNMMLDNNEKKKVWEWIENHIECGEMSVVTGYFTVAALAWFANKTNEKINKYRFILGDIVHSQDKIKSLDLLNQDVSIETALKLSDFAKKSVKFLEQKNVELKTLEPNFCHAKLCLFKDQNENKNKNNFFISGSSNLTEAGVGLKNTPNVELNIAETGNNLQYQELEKWFEELWKKEQAHSKKILENGKEIDFKKYLIQEISKIFKEYTPKEIYEKIVFELFDDNENIDSEQENKNLKQTVVYNKLFDFQKNAVENLKIILKKYNGAILADAVGLGKTWTALAIIKYYEFKGYQTILLCPKRLDQNWKNYLRKQNSVLEDDKFDYTIRFHTDLNEKRLKSYTDIGKDDLLFVSDKPKLFVIDESHNLRNENSKRYEFLLNEILRKNKNVKVLMLTATPINNSFLDIGNQIKLIQTDFNEKFEIEKIETLFKNTVGKFKEWRNLENPSFDDLYNNLPEKYRDLIGKITVARTKKTIKKIQTDLKFPIKEKPQKVNDFNLKIEDFENFEKILEILKINFAGYRPAYYANRTSENQFKDEAKRDTYLVKMMKILLFKRLESSWFSFKSTLEKFYEKHKFALSEVEKYEEKKLNKNNKKRTNSEENSISESIDFWSEEEDEDNIFSENNMLPENEIDSKRKIKVCEIDAAGNLQDYKKHLKDDLNQIKALLHSLQKFTPQQDEKLDRLRSLIKNKQKKTNKKVLIFTVYRDTARYLFDELKNDFDRIAFVSGQNSEVKNEAETKKYEDILKRFAPFGKTGNEITKNPIDILIATDCLSEGQNLQDCDYIINYDIHWNPVRLIQRLGRIDRINSPNEKISYVNFWPTKDIDAYIKLKPRIENRMAAVATVGSEVPEEFLEATKSEEIENQQLKKMFEQLEENSDELISDDEISFDKFSFARFREILTDDKRKELSAFPNGIFSGFIEKTETLKSGLIALLRNQKATKKEIEKKDNYKLIHIDFSGNSIFFGRNNILEFLDKNKNLDRYVPKEIDECEKETVQKYSAAINEWFEKNIEPEDNKREKDMNQGNLSLSEFDENTETNKQKFKPENWDLICWMVVSG